MPILKCAMCPVLFWFSKRPPVRLPFLPAEEMEAIPCELTPLQLENSSASSPTFPSLFSVPRRAAPFLCQAGSDSALSRLHWDPDSFIIPFWSCIFKLFLCTGALPSASTRSLDFLNHLSPNPSPSFLSDKHLKDAVFSITMDS